MIPPIHTLQTLSNTPARAVLPNWHIYESHHQLLTKTINAALVTAHAGGGQDQTPAALLMFPCSDRGVHSTVPRQGSFPVSTGRAGPCNAMPWRSRGLDIRGLYCQQEQRTREGFNPHLGAIRLNDKWPAPEHTKCLWQSTELCSSGLWTRLMPFLADCPSFNQLRHLSIESKWNEKQANAPRGLFI